MYSQYDRGRQEKKYSNHINYYLWCAIEYN